MLVFDYMICLCYMISKQDVSVGAAAGLEAE
jgi:hypothetical protein